MPVREAERNYRRMVADFGKMIAGSKVSMKNLDFANFVLGLDAAGMQPNGVVLICDLAESRPYSGR